MPSLLFVSSGILGFEKKKKLALATSTNEFVQLLFVYVIFYNSYNA